jgi:hypothetical protein|tara:strand:+ start:218 stop:466 length:249 start_codon:yes stop_codon:yes gene_type:complete
MTHRFDEIKPSHHISKKEVQEMIDLAIKQHNYNASIISMILGTIVLALFLDGLLRLLGIIPPFMGLNVSIIQEIIDKIKNSY